MMRLIADARMWTGAEVKRRADMTRRRWRQGGIAQAAQRRLALSRRRQAASRLRRGVGDANTLGRGQHTTFSAGVCPGDFRRRTSAVCFNVRHEVQVTRYIVNSDCGGT